MGFATGEFIKVVPDAVVARHRIPMCTEWINPDEPIAQAGLNGISKSEADPNKKYSLKEAMGFGKAGIQVVAVMEGQTTAVCLGMPLLNNGYREPFDQMAFDILQTYTAENAIFFQTGPENITAFVPGDFSPDELLKNMVNSYSFYGKYFPEFSDAAKHLQDIQQGELVNDKNGNGSRFKRAINGENIVDEAIVNFDGTSSFVFAYEIVQDEIGAWRLGRKGPDGKYYYFDALAKEGDVEMANMLKYGSDVVTSLKGKSGIYIKIYFDKSADCMNTSINANLSGRRDSIITTNSFVDGNNYYPGAPVVENSQYCSGCNKSKSKCICEEKESK